MTADGQIPGRLGALLDEERRLILAADYRALARLLVEKAGLLAAIEASAGGPDRLEVARIGRMARRNQVLAGAAAEGLRAAMRRLAELQNLQRGCGTYGSGGQRSTFAEGARIERRF